MDEQLRRKRKAPGEAARRAAVAARRAKMLIPVDKTAPEVFAVRSASLPTPFSWEIRRFGSIILLRGDSLHPTASEAVRDGWISLKLTALPEMARGPERPPPARSL